MEEVTRTENEHSSTVGFDPNTWIGIVCLFTGLMIFSWGALRELKDLNSIGQCVADARSPSGTLQVHIERYGDCDPAALAREARAAVLPEAETE